MAEMGEAVDAFAKGLQDAQVQPGTKIGLLLPNCPQFLVAFYGSLKAGMTVVNYNPLYAEQELEYQIEDSETDIMVTLDLKATYDKAGLCWIVRGLKILLFAVLLMFYHFRKTYFFQL